ncbi:MAG: hypothetical protein R3C40_07300 [Parvularculaceae bacterium]
MPAVAAGDRAPQTGEGLAGRGLARVTWREGDDLDGLAQMLAIIPAPAGPASP